jgi:SAM-dependent methyltransferase
MTGLDPPGNASWSETPGGSFKPTGKDAARAMGAYLRMGSHSRRYLFARARCAGRSVLDFGCGYGVGRLLLGDAVPNYTGVDLDPKAVDWARANVEPVHPGSTRFFSTTEFLPSKSLPEVAIAFEVIEHVRDPSKLMQTILNSIRSDGVVILSTPNGAFYNPEKKNPFHFREYHWTEMDRLLRSSGLSVTYFKERRIDALDVVGRKLLGSRLMGGELGEGASVLTRSDSLLGAIFNVYRNRLDGPGFWSVTPATRSTLSTPDYSTLLMVCERAAP